MIDAKTEPIVLKNIPLDRVEQFFDQALWLEVLSGHQSRDDALNSIACQTKGILLYYAQMAAASDDIQAKARLHIERAEQEILSSLLAQLRLGTVVATGFAAGSAKRDTIDAELWDELKPNFMAGDAQSEQFHFKRVELSLASKMVVDLDELALWLQEHKLRGESRKKLLIAAARQYFGSRLRDRAFNTAYGAVFGHNRGRPRRGADK